MLAYLYTRTSTKNSENNKAQLPESKEGCVLLEKMEGANKTG